MTEASREPGRPLRRLLWRTPAIVGALALIIHLVGQRMVDDDASLQSVIAVLSWFLAFVVVSVWWLFFSGVRWRTRFAGVAGFLGLMAVFMVLFRFEGQAGNFIPQFSFRFSESAEERALNYFASVETKETKQNAISDDFDGPDADNLANFLMTEEDWPRFGGPNGDHIVRGETIRADWETNPPQLLWRHPVGPGWSSFAVVGDLVFTQEQRGESECVVCYDANNGEQIWLHEDEERFEESASGAGPRATPTVHDSRLYALGATGILNCLDPQTGIVFWSVDTAEDNGGELIEWAAAGSPVVHEDLVLVNPGTTTCFLAAYDRMTGERQWSGPEAKAGYATPIVVAIDGVFQVVMYRAAGVGGYSIATGEELWFFEWVNATQINAAQPIVLPDGSIFVSTGYGGGSARLDIAHTGETWSVTSRWESPNKFKLKFNGGIYREGHVYGLDEGILSCFDIDRGKRNWKKGRYSFGQILMVDDRLLVITEQGDVVLVDVNSQSMQELARFKAIDGKTWNHPVLNRGRLFVRNGNEAACYDLRPVVAD